MESLIIAMLCCVPLVQSAAVRGPDKWFVGWKGQTYNPDIVWNATAEQGVGEATSDGSQWVEQLSWKPRAYLFHNFLSPDECNHIIKAASPYMKRSTVLQTKKTSITDSIRTSYGTFLRRYEDDVIGEIEERLANWTQLPVVNQEDMQVLRYSVGQQYGAHLDVINEEVPRFATVLLYLNDVQQGGETAFPILSVWANPDLSTKYGPWSECAANHVAVKPRKGDALLFYSLHMDMTPDFSARHTGCPVIEGIKWTATKWIHVGPFRESELHLVKYGKPPMDPGVCADQEDRCEEWASSGECTKNPEYMTGENSTGLGACRKACRTCEVCAAQDSECYKKNREQAGFLSFDDHL